MKSMLQKRKLDKLGRLLIPEELFDFAFPDRKKVAFCYRSDHVAVIKNAEDVTELDVVIYVRYVDDKNRITIPKEMRRSFQDFEVYVLNHEIVVRGVE